MNPAKKLMEAKFKIEGQWYYRGNRSPTWLFCASRTDGSMCGIAEKVPQDWYPLLEAFSQAQARVAELEKALETVKTQIVNLPRSATADVIYSVVIAALKDRA